MSNFASLTDPTQLAPVIEGLQRQCATPEGRAKIITTGQEICRAVSDNGHTIIGIVAKAAPKEERNQTIADSAEIILLMDKLLQIPTSDLDKILEQFSRMDTDHISDLLSEQFIAHKDTSKDALDKLEPDLVPNIMGALRTDFSKAAQQALLDLTDAGFLPETADRPPSIRRIDFSAKKLNP